MWEEAEALVRRLSGLEEERGPVLWKFAELAWLLQARETPDPDAPVTGQAMDELVGRYETLRRGGSPMEGSVPILGTGEEVLTRGQAAAFFRRYYRRAEKR